MTVTGGAEETLLLVSLYFFKKTGGRGAKASPPTLPSLQVSYTPGGCTPKKIG